MASFSVQVSAAICWEHFWSVTNLLHAFILKDSFLFFLRTMYERETWLPQTWVLLGFAGCRSIVFPEELIMIWSDVLWQRMLWDAVRVSKLRKVIWFSNQEVIKFVCNWLENIVVPTSLSVCFWYRGSVSVLGRKRWVGGVAPSWGRGAEDTSNGQGLLWWLCDGCEHPQTEVTNQNCRYIYEEALTGLGHLSWTKLGRAQRAGKV